MDCTLNEDKENLITIDFSRFSITKWIHLNEGDDGLTQFFQRVYEVLRPGGAFFLEPQEWDSYAKAKRMDPVRILPLFPSEDSLLKVLFCICVETERGRKEPQTAPGNGLRACSCRTGL